MSAISLQCTVCGATQEIPDGTKPLVDNVVLTCEICGDTAELPYVGKEQDFVSVIPAKDWQLYPRHLCPKCGKS